MNKSDGNGDAIPCRYNFHKAAGGCPYKKSCGCGGKGGDDSVKKSVNALDIVNGARPPEAPTLSKAARPKAPPGYQPIPNGKKGGFRKREGAGYVYWYPDREGGSASVNAADGFANTSKDKVKEAQDALARFHAQNGSTNMAPKFKQEIEAKNPEAKKLREAVDAARRSWTHAENVASLAGGRSEYHEEIPEYNLDIVAGEDGKVSKEDIERAHDIAKKVKAGIDSAADVCKLSPPVCTGNLGIPRDQMPQISEKSVKEMLASDDPEERKKGQAAVDVGADPNDDTPIFDQLLSNLKKEGVKVSKESIEVGKLKATQREIKAGKTYGMADAYLKGKFKPQDAEILISSDNHILDGHHRYAALITASPDVKMKVTRVDMPMKEFLARSFKQPGVFRADLQGNIVDPKTPLDLSGSNTKKSLYEWALAHPEEAREVVRKAQTEGIPSRGVDPLALVKAETATPEAFRYGSYQYESRLDVVTPERSVASLAKSETAPITVEVVDDRASPLDIVRRGGTLMDPLSNVWKD